MEALCLMTIKRLNVPGPVARAVLTRDAATISPSYPREYPFVMDRGRGSEVWGWGTAYGPGKPGAQPPQQQRSPAQKS
jgi:hypothetical protein